MRDKRQTAPVDGRGGTDRQRGHLLSMVNYNHLAPDCQPPLENFALDLADLQAAAQAAKDAGNYNDFWRWRRAYLLAQAASYSGGMS